MSEKIVQLNEEVIKGQIKELVRGSVEETLNELLEKEAEQRRRFNITFAIAWHLRSPLFLSSGTAPKNAHDTACSSVIQAHNQLYIKLNN